MVCISNDGENWREREDVAQDMLQIVIAVINDPALPFILAVTVHIVRTIPAFLLISHQSLNIFKGISRHLFIIARALG